MRTSIATLSLSFAVASLALTGGATTALAQRNAGPGLGVELPLTDQLLDANTGWVSFVYDTGGPLHFDVLAQFVDIEDTSSTFGFGGRLYYSMHRSSAADFSIGGGLFLVHTSVDATDTDFNDINIELGPKIRVFLAPAVAIHTTFGLGVALADGDGRADVIGLVGRLNGALGITYFFR